MWCHPILHLYYYSCLSKIRKHKLLISLSTNAGYSFSNTQLLLTFPLTPHKSIHLSRLYLLHTTADSLKPRLISYLLLLKGFKQYLITVFIIFRFFNFVKNFFLRFSKNPLQKVIFGVIINQQELLLKVFVYFVQSILKGVLLWHL